MPVCHLSRIALAVLLLAASAASSAASDPCPPGQHQVCLGFCLCLPGAREEMEPLYDSVGQLAARGLEEWIVSSRRAVPDAELQPIPLHVRAQLARHFDLAVLDTVRYTVGNTAVFDSGHSLLLHNPDVRAVTLIDLIVFRDARSASEDIALWAHELKHVEQYLEWGVSEFARRYSRDHAAVEAPGYALQRQVAGELRAAARAAPLPGGTADPDEPVAEAPPPGPAVE